MSFRYRERTVVDGEAIDPHDWKENINSLVGEINGKLDRDNFPIRVFETKHVKDEVFNQLVQANDFTYRSHDDVSTHDVHVIEKDFEEDGVLIVHIGGTFQSRVGQTNTLGKSDKLFHIACMVNGTIVSNVRKISANYEHCGFYAVGTYPVVAGSTQVKITIRCEADVSGNLSNSYQVNETSITIQYKRR